MDPVIAPIPPDQELRELLAECDLLFSDLGVVGDRRFFGCEREGQLAGAVGIERYGVIGLLRSLAVTPRWRGAGLGAALVAEAEAEARRLGVRRLYLLTTTASAFFARLGYQRTSRDDAPPPLCATEQFTSLCPSSSHLMVKRLST